MIVVSIVFSIIPNGAIWSFRVREKKARNSVVIAKPAQSSQITTEPAAHIWGFPKIRGIILGVPIIRIIIYWGLYWGPPTLGKYHL